MAMQCLHGGWGGAFDREMQEFFATLADRIFDEWPDPAGLGPATGNGMDNDRKQRAQTLLKAAERETTLAINLARQGRNGEVLRAWRGLFGPKSPCPEAQIMSDFSRPKLLSSLYEDIQHRLRVVRESIQHPGSKGDASEGVWISLLQKYLPQRYQADKAFVVDSHGNFSQQIDVVVFDRQYSPFIFNCEDTLIVPAESVYAVFEAKQSADRAMVQYAQEKVASVRRL